MIRRHLNFHDELFEEIFNQANRESRSFNNMVMHGMKVYLELKRTQSPCGDCTLQDVRCGRVGCQFEKFNK